MARARRAAARRRGGARARRGALQDKAEDGAGQLTKQRLVLGTHTSEGEQNYLMLAEVALPAADCEAEARGYDEERGEVGGFGSAAGRVQARARARAARPQWRGGAALRKRCQPGAPSGGTPGAEL